MEDLIALLIPLLAAAGWLFGLFNKDTSDTNQQQERQENRNPVPRPARTNREQPNVSREDIPTPEGGTKEYYENKLKEAEQLKSETKRVSTTISRADINAEENQENLETSSRKIRDKGSDTDTVISVKRNMTKHKLAESIIMAEVLGPPRSLRPYRNTSLERRK